MGRTPRDLVQAFAALAERPTPALVWRSGPERVELSGRVLVNWVEKAAGLLTEELDVVAGEVVSVSTVPHWRLVVIALAGLRVGARVQLTRRPGAGAAVHAFLETDPDDAADAQHVLVVAAPALAFSCANPVPPGAVDFADEVRGMADVYSGVEVPDPGAPALDTGISHGDLVASAVEAVPDGAADTVHLPLAEDWGEPELLRLLGTILSGRAVLLTARPEDASQEVLLQERAAALP